MFRKVGRITEGIRAREFATLAWIVLIVAVVYGMIYVGFLVGHAEGTKEAREADACPFGHPHCVCGAECLCSERRCKVFRNSRGDWCLPNCALPNPFEKDE